MPPTITQQSALIESCAAPANTNRVGSWIGWGRIILDNLNIIICMSCILFMFYAEAVYILASHTSHT